MIRTAVTIVAIVAMACRQAPSGQRATTDSALAALKRGDTALALQRLDSAAGTDTADVRAFRLRADVHRARGDLARAIADYDRAIQLKPGDAGLFADRGLARQQGSEYDLAVKDFGQALALRPNHAMTVKNRGRTYFYMGRFAEAATDLRQGAALDSTNAFIPVWQHIALRRAGQDNRQELEAQLAKTDQVAWPAPLARYLLGKATHAELLAAAAVVDPRVGHDQKCAVSFYLGELAIADGKPADAAKLLEEAAAGCPRSWTEWQASTAELARLRAR